jgi:hypothetical protein
MYVSFKISLIGFIVIICIFILGLSLGLQFGINFMAEFVPIYLNEPDIEKYKLLIKQRNRKIISEMFN